MTAREAIDVIRSECYVINPLNFDRSTIINTALDMAVKALSAEPCEDAISRKWLKNAIHNFYKGLIHTPTEEDIQAYIDVAPSVKPLYTEAEIQKMQEMEQAEIQKAYELGKAEQPKMGHWKRVSADKYVQHATYYYRCSECDNDIIGEHNYCPHCGAKMEVEDEG